MVKNKTNRIINNERGFGLLGILLVIILIAACIMGTHVLIGYWTNYSMFIYIVFAATLLLVILTKAKFEFFNWIFLIGCWALATRLFPYFFSIFEGDYMTFYYSEYNRNLWEWIKMSALYYRYMSSSY